MGAVAVFVVIGSVLVALVAVAVSWSRPDEAEGERAEPPSGIDALWRTVAETAADGILLLDRRGVVLAANAAAERMLGWAAGEGIGRDVATLVPAREVGSGPTAPALWRRFLADGERRSIGCSRELTALRADGSALPVEVRVSKARVEGRRVFAAVVRDVSERRRAEAALRQLGTAIEQSHSLVLITDRAGTIVYVNARFTEVTGYRPEEAVGENPRILKGGDTTPAEYEALWRTLLSGCAWRGELHNRRKDGTDYWASAVITPVRDEKGEITHFVGVQDDVTERRAERAAAERQSRELAEARDRLARQAAELAAARAGARSDAATPRDPAPARAPIRVLLAEDFLVNQRVAARMLKRLGCRVDVACDGREAAEMAARSRYDVVFMDCLMPELDGFEATAQIRAAERGGDRTPVVAMTANAVQGDRERCLAAGMDDYVSKPISIEDLRVVLERWCSREVPAVSTRP